jgi:hypothetical protein
MNSSALKMLVYMFLFIHKKGGGPLYYGYMKPSMIGVLIFLACRRDRARKKRYLRLQGGHLWYSPQSVNHILSHLPTFITPDNSESRPLVHSGICRGLSSTVEARVMKCKEEEEGVHDGGENSFSGLATH